jgi:glycosyltransferase involved in cell wall biosynthesis
MRVLLLNPLYPPDLGGAELQAQRLARELAARGTRVTVLTRPCAGEPISERDGDIRVVRGLTAIAVGPLWGLTYMMSTHRWLRRLACDWDVLHSQQVNLHCWPSVRVSRALGKPCLFRFACSGPGGDLAVLSRRRFGRYFVTQLRGATRLVALTQGGAEEIRRFRLPVERVRTIPNGVDLQQFAVQPWPQVDTSQPLRLLFVGRLDRQKGLDVLLDALQRVKRPAAFTLRIIGVGPEFERLRAQAYQAGLDPIAEFHGLQQDVTPHYAWSELVVLPSRFEGMPNVVLEAMACARPVLGTSIDGTAELIGPATGWLVPSDDAGILAQRLTQIANERATLASIGLAGRAVAEAKYSISVVASMYLREYEAMLSEGAGANR